MRILKGIAALLPLAAVLISVACAIGMWLCVMVWAYETTKVMVGL